MQTCDECNAPAVWQISVTTYVGHAATPCACGEHVNSVIELWTTDRWAAPGQLTRRVEVERIVR